MQQFFFKRFPHWILYSWTGFLVLGLFLLLHELSKEGYFFKLTDMVVLRPTHEKFMVGLFALRIFLRRTHKQS